MPSVDVEDMLAILISVARESRRREFEGVHIIAGISMLGSLEGRSLVLPIAAMVLAAWL